MQFGLDFSGGTSGPADFSSILGGGSKPSAGADLSSMLGGLASSASASGAPSGFLSFLGAAGTGALTGSALGPIGAVAGAGLGGLMSLFSSKGVPDHERSDLKKIAAGANVTEEQASWVCGDEADNGSANYDDVCRKYANNIPGFLARVNVYNSTHPQSVVVPGPTAQQVAQQQQQLITTATTTLGFANTATGQQLVAALQSVPANEAVGTQGQTAGDILAEIVKGIGNGALKGGSDAAAETDLGKSFKKDYLKTWIKENQLLAAGIGAFGAFGLIELYKKTLGKGGKISL